MPQLKKDISKTQSDYNVFPVINDNFDRVPKLKKFPGFLNRDGMQLDDITKAIDGPCTFKCKHCNYKTSQLGSIKVHVKS